MKLQIRFILNVLLYMFHGLAMNTSSGIISGTRSSQLTPSHFYD